MSNRPAQYASLGALILIWGTTWAAIRIGLRGIPPLTGVALRFGIAAVVLLALARGFGVRLGAERYERRLWLSNTVLTFCISYGIVYWAEQWVPSGLASVLFATYPLWVALLAHAALPGERLSVRQAAGILVGFAGVAVIFSEDLRALGGPRVAAAAAILLISPVCSALGSVAVKRWGAGIPPLSLAAVPMGATALLLGPLALVCESGRTVHFDASAIGSLLYLALAGSALSFTLFFWLLERLPATTLSLINYAHPVVAVTVGGIWLREPVTSRTLLGAGLVIVGVVVAAWARAAAQPTRQPRQGRVGTRPPD
ncbi:MAG TPA: EamA family transporter [Thermoanaerobaculia bacterium]|nr:EamA family transporter [Thermoanaerobaculia bacterium]